ncbi:MAG: hypothetical protein ACPHRO_08685, partial [Nannocystaceae bacterium]
MVDVMKRGGRGGLAAAFAVAMAVSFAPAASSAFADKVGADCTLKGFQLYGKIKVVENFPDLKVQVVEHFPDLKVQTVNNFPD